MAKKEFKTLSDEWFYNRDKFVKANHYEFERWAICGECIFFRLGHFNPSDGECLLMCRSCCGVNSSVSIQGICDRYISSIGTDRNGKEVFPSIEH
jgi:hypothetical protein